MNLKKLINILKNYTAGLSIIRFPISNKTETHIDIKPMNQLFFELKKNHQYKLSKINIFDGYLLQVKNISKFNTDYRCTMLDVINDIIPTSFSKNPVMIEYFKMVYIECVNNLKHNNKLITTCVELCKKKFNPECGIEITKSTTINDIHNCIWNVKSSRFNTQYEALNNLNAHIDENHKIITIHVSFTHIK